MSCTFKRAPRRGGQRRQRPSTGSESNNDDEDNVVAATKKVRTGGIQSSSGRLTKSDQKRQQESSEDSDGESQVRRELLGLDTYKSVATSERAGPSDMGATATNESETALNKDAQAQFERVAAVHKERREGRLDDRVYKGMEAYGGFVEKQDTAAGKASSGLVRMGPIRAANFVRQSVIWDYKADLCKDYKETGFCTFGDSCKFMHDRGDYKHGWEIEKDLKTGKFNAPDEDYTVSSSDDDDLPFKCSICRDSFVTPIITRCHHYFCEKCALAHYRKTQKCHTCEVNTGGVFNPAKDLMARMSGEATLNEKRRKAIRAERDEHKMTSEEDSDVEEADANGPDGQGDGPDGQGDDDHLGAQGDEPDK